MQIYVLVIDSIAEALQIRDGKNIDFSACAYRHMATASSQTMDLVMDRLN
jgi:hypothetical protein